MERYGDSQEDNEHSMKKVLLIPDVPNWGWAEWARCTRAEGYEVVVRDSGSVPQDPDWRQSFDGVLHYSWPECPARGEYRRLVTVVSSEGLMFNEYDPENYRSIIYSKWRNTSRARDKLNSVDAVISVNRRLHKYTRGMGICSTYLPSGVDWRFWRSDGRQPSDALRVGWCGQSPVGEHNPKGFEWIMPEVLKRLEGIVEFKINRRTAQDALSREEMLRWYNSIDVFLCTSVSEATPNTGHEAMACECCVVSTDVGDMSYLIDEGNGFLVGTYRNALSAKVVTERIIERLRYLKDHRGHVAECGSRARRTVIARRNWTELAPKWLEVIAP